MSKVSTVVQAQRRAQLEAYLNNNVGMHTAVKIAQSMPGVSSRTVGQMLGAMARNGLIPPMVKRGANKYWHGADHGPGAEPITDDNAPPIPRPTSKPKATANGSEVEVVLDGMTIIVGRNPATGRFRVILEG